MYHAWRTSGRALVRPEPALYGAAARVAEYIDRLEARALAAERVCEAAVEVSVPSVKGERIAQRQTRFLRALAEWRATKE